tara:strand:- start:533 stop:1897 length:1365 start_codon:yes stop_codon:yes gene_type:complete
MVLKKSDLTHEQVATIDRLYGHNETLLIAGVGFGKACIALTAIQELIEDKHLKRVLLLAPKQVCALTYSAEPGKWEHLNDDAVQVLNGTPEQRLEQLNGDASIVVANFELVPWLMKQDLSFDGLCIDELSKMKTVGSTTVKKLRHFVKKLSWRCGMSATPVAECGADIYSQAMLIDNGAALGTRKTTFLETYMVSTDFERRNWVWSPGGLDRAAKRLGNLIYVPDEKAYTAGLPMVVEKTIAVVLPEAARTVYALMEGHGIAQLNDHSVVAGSMGVRTGKLNQIAAGGLYSKNEDEEQILVAEWAFKQKALAQYMADVFEPVLIVYQYTFQLTWLRALYPDAPILGGGFKIKPGTMDAWDRGELPVMLGHPKAFSHGLNLQYGCSHLVLLSPIWSADQHHQTLGRLLRRGQKAPFVKRTTFIAADTIEEDMLSRQDTKTARADEASAALKAHSN